MGKPWPPWIGMISFGYGGVLAFFAISALSEFTFGRHPNAPPVRLPEWVYLPVTIAAALSLIAVGVTTRRSDFGIVRSRRLLLACAAVLFFKAAVVGWMVSSFLRNPSGPLDGLIVAFVPFSIAPTLIWACVLLFVSSRLGREKEAT